ncbi:MAG: D-alanine--D-alanine ligase [Treponema sp.]|jgi:D-alanine-D-alanine ligase|nr:D-alanine--D-alanine ligase [Treponema sp.]
MAKLNVGILCGGKSAEHEVSLQSAINIYDAIDREKYTPVLIGIDKSGGWNFGSGGPKQCIGNPENPKNICLRPGRAAALTPESAGRLTGAVRDSDVVQDFPKLDVIFPILHGPFGEDGTVQGLLKLANLPFVGSGVLGSAVGMDKDVMKRLLRDAGIPIGKFLVIRDGPVTYTGGPAAGMGPVDDGKTAPAFAASKFAAPKFDDVAAELGLPVFVKPANMGSSVGVSKVNGEEQYRAALEEAFRFDTKVIVEENIPGREIECSVLGNENPIASVPGEIRAANEFYSYEAKYIDPDGAALEIPAKLPPETTRQIQSLAVKTFQVLECSGLSRVDFFLKDNDRVIVNEINTMPGFTKISMYPKLWEASGIGYAELIDRLIQLAIERFNREKHLATSYQG